MNIHKNLKKYSNNNDVYDQDIISGFLEDTIVYKTKHIRRHLGYEEFLVSLKLNFWLILSRIRCGNH